MNRRVNSIFPIIIGTLTLFLSIGKSNASTLFATSTNSSRLDFTLGWDDSNSDGIIQNTEVSLPITAPQFSGVELGFPFLFDTLKLIPNIPGVTSGFYQSDYWGFGSPQDQFSTVVPVNAWDYNTIVPRPLTLSFSGNLGSSSFPLLSGGTFTGIGELPDFNIDELFLPGGVALTSGSMEFFESSGQFLPSEVTGGYIQAMAPVPPSPGTPFLAEIVSTGTLFSLNVNCIDFGGQWIPDGVGGLVCIFGFRHPDIVNVIPNPILSPSILANAPILANQSSVILEWLSGEITVDLADGTQVTTPVTSANFSLSPQSIPEPTSTLSLFAFGILGAASTLKRKLKSSKSTEKETTKVG
jgi:hypothetical protein